MKSKLAKISLLLSLALLLNGCGPIHSLSALYQADDTAFEDGLVGTWHLVSESDADKGARWIFEHPGDDKFYSFTWGNAKVKGGFVARARLVKLNGNLFVDFEGDTKRGEDALGQGSFMAFPTISTHMIGRIWLQKDSLKVRLLSQDWVDKQIAAGNFSLAHEKVDGGEILTTKTADLRKFVQEHADDESAFSEEFTLVRAK